MDADLGDFDQAYRPPLASELFDKRPAFGRILAKYPKAESLSARIRTDIGRGRGVEEVLRSMAADPRVEVRRMFYEVPLYLQELIGTVSEKYVTSGGTRFDVLIDALSASDRPYVLISLNYDLFVERALRNFYGVDFVATTDYCSPGRRWQFIKLHGSVNWGRVLVNGGPSDRKRFPDLSGQSIELRGEACVVPGHDDSARWHKEEFHYPELAVPIGDRDGFVCPGEHCSIMTEALSKCGTLLNIGFSGRDRHVLEAIAKHRYSYYCFVNGPAEEGYKAAEMFKRAAGISFANEDVTFSGGFKQFVASGRLNEMVAI